MIPKINGLSLDMLTHPGETLEELLNKYSMSQVELANRIGVSKKHINEIIKGKKNISSSMANKLSNVFNLSATFWNNLQKIYDEQYETIMDIENISLEEKNIVIKLPLDKLIEYGYAEDVYTTIQEKVLFFRKFLGLSNLTNNENYLNSAITFRKSMKLKYDPYVLSIWLQMCMVETEKKTNNKFDLNILKNNIPRIKSLIIKEDITEITKDLENIFSECGVAFTLVHHLTGAPVQGFIRYYGDIVIMCLTIRNKYSDIFWFTLFHEIGHLLSSRSQKPFVDFLDNSNEEVMADKFAQNILIEEKKYKELLNNQTIDENIIIDFAKECNIIPGIIVGRLQHDGIIGYNQYNSLRQKIAWND